MVPAAAMFLMMTLVSCSTKPEPFVLGKDACADCRMTIMDPKFGGEIITQKGRIYKFDDAHCLASFIKAGHVKESEIKKTVFIDYEHPSDFLDASGLFFLVSPELKSPMNSHAAAYSSRTAAEQKAAAVGGNIVDWNTLYKSL
jgi:copper chaperone NosL